MNYILLVGLVIVFVAVYVFTVYNHFVTLKTRIKASIQEIGNQLKRQADLIPNLVSSVKGYMKHEKGIFKDLTDARKMILSAVKSGNAQKMIDASAATNSALKSVNVLFESTPELKAAGPTTKLMDELRDTADKVMYSRRTLIDLSADYNIMTVRFPTNLVAKVLDFKQEVGLKMPQEAKASATEVKKEELKTPKVKLD